jgi:glycosyltransferase involved in cell wall biosynthesis
VDLNKPIILFASFITPRKGLEYLARAYPHFYQKPNLIIVGKWRNENYREQIRTLLNKNVDEYIEAGFVLDQEMPMYYSVADIYVSPSLVEGFGLSLAEALACETPVVAFDSGSVAEVVGPGGILVPPKDVDGLVNAVNYLLMNPDVRKSMGKAGRTYVERNFSIGSMRDSTIAAYKRFLGVIG